MRICLLIVGQSLEKGNCTLSDHSTTCPARIASTGAPVSNLNNLSPSNKHYWDLVAEHLYRQRGYWVTVRNIAQGSTGIVTHWCGDAGDGSPLTMSDDGFDPNDYLAAALTEINKCPNYDEYWAVVSFGQTDTSELTAASDYAAGHLNVAEYLNSIGVDKVFLGLSVHTENDAGDHYSSALTPGVDSAIAEGRPYIYRGANLRQLLGRAATVPLFDGVHTTLAAQRQAARAWANQIAKLQQT